jgi:hypothetical protein
MAPRLAGRDEANLALLGRGNRVVRRDEATRCALSNFRRPLTGLPPQGRAGAKHSAGTWVAAFASHGPR